MGKKNNLNSMELEKKEKSLNRSVLKYFIDVAVICIDFFIISFLWFSLYLKVPFTSWKIEITLPVYLVIVLSLNTLFRLYRNIWRYFSVRDILFSMISMALSCIIFIIVIVVVNPRISNFDNIPGDGSVGNFIWFAGIVSITVGVLTIISRLLYREYYFLQNRQKEDIRRLAIVGGGSVCAALLSALNSITNKVKYNPVCIFDDDPNKIGCRIEGVKIVAEVDKIPEICQSLKIDEIIIALPSATNEEIRRIIDICLKTNCQINRMPAMAYLIDNENDYWGQVRKINVEDLLGRKAVTMDEKDILEYVCGKAVLVTGGGGSIGSEICRQIAAYKPKKLVILDEYENNAYEIQQELIRKYGADLDMNVEIATICDKQHIDFIFAKYKPNLVFHAAAHKHVPLMEDNPEEAVKNNIFGTYNVVMAAHNNNVDRFIQISTDKAVNPTNVMGATKRFCEMIVQSTKQFSKTVFAAVRFGNVLGSNGSVIPLFKRQIEEGGPVTVTHKDMKRYFMTIPEAVELVLLAGKQAKSGNVYVLDMGEPVKIYDFAKKMITLSGFTPGRDIKIEITGLRPGEKLFEELVLNPDRVDKTENDKVFIEKLPSIKEKDVKTGMEVLRESLKSDNPDDVKVALAQVVTTYSPTDRHVIKMIEDLKNKRNFA